MLGTDQQRQDSPSQVIGNVSVPLIVLAQEVCRLAQSAFNLRVQRRGHVVRHQPEGFKK